MQAQQQHQQQQQQNSVSSKKPPIYPNRQQYQQCFNKNNLSSPSSSMPLNNYSNINYKHISSGNSINSSNNQKCSMSCNTSSYASDQCKSNIFTLSRENIFPIESIPSPYSYVSPYSDNDPIRVVRKAKSDIGVPIQRFQSTKASMKNNLYSNITKPRLSSIKSDLVLSYVNTFDNNFPSNYQVSNSNDIIYRQQHIPSIAELSSMNDLRSMMSNNCNMSSGNGISNSNSNKSTKFNNCLHYIGDKPNTNLQTIMENKYKNSSTSSNCDFSTTNDFIPSSRMIIGGPLVYLEKMNNLYTNTPTSSDVSIKFIFCLNIINAC